jgi:hypothetical protein
MEDNPQFKITKHAASRIMERRLSKNRVTETIRRGKKVWLRHKDGVPYIKHVLCGKKEDYCVITSVDGIVITAYIIPRKQRIETFYIKGVKRHVHPKPCIP